MQFEFVAKDDFLMMSRLSRRNNNKKHVRQAAESLSLEQARERMPNTEAWIKAIMLRLDPYLPDHRPLRVLDVGSAQGRALIVLTRLGHEAYGVEPWEPAREVARELAESEGVDITFRAGMAEDIPFEDNSFDVVIATGVMEHVMDLRQSLNEIYRVLRPGGLFWFNSASSMCPLQGEIDGFPFFGWYPDPLKVKIMNWVKVHRPKLVGYTDTPAIHWWTPWKANRLLREAGFEKVWDRWELRRSSESSSQVEAWAVELAQRYRLVRFAGDIVAPGCSYAARK